MDRIWDLSEKLRSDGVDCRIDQHEESPPEGWPRWCRNQIQAAQFVLVACTETYQRRYEGTEKSGRGLGGQWEGFVITQELYEARGQIAKFVPIIFSGNAAKFIPIELQGLTYYDLSTETDYVRLYRRLTGQPGRSPSPVGVPKVSGAPTPSRRSPSPEEHVSVTPSDRVSTAAVQPVREGDTTSRGLYELRRLMSPTGGKAVLDEALLEASVSTSDFVAPGVTAEAEVAQPTPSGAPQKAAPPERPFEIPPTPKVVSDQWVTDDTLGYQSYARAVASLITHPNTVPPLTIGLEAPWGAGKTSVMKMIQHFIDGEAQLTEQNEAGMANRRVESQISVRTLLDNLTKPGFDTHIAPKQSAEGAKYELPGRATVWFNAWKYQTSEQVWAGLAHCIINHVTVRMDARTRELFWLKLNSRRVDVNALRRKIYETALFDLLPRVFRWVIILALLLVIIAALFVAGVSGISPLLATILHWASPAAAVVAAIDLWRKGRAAVNFRFDDKARGDLLKVVREPDYEGKMGFLYLVESDVREVLDLVATPKSPLVIFIDDLDRCVPHKVAEVVEAVSLFLAGDYPNCIFVLGMEPHIVAAALEVANADLIKRLGELGFGDESAPMGWRFMEKIVQLPLALPPPTKIGMDKYLNTLAPTNPEMPERTAAPLPSLPPPPADEGHVQKFVQVLQQEPALSSVVTQTEKLLAQEPEADMSAIAEASKRVFLRKFDEHDPLVRKVVELAIEVFGANPRQIKRYVNLFRLCCNLRHSIWLDSVQLKISIELPNDADITKFVAFSVQWPQATSLLRRTVGGERTDGRAAQSMLALLEQTAAQLESDRSRADAQWETVIQQCNLSAAAWAKSPQFRRYLATGDSISAAANKGLW